MLTGLTGAITAISLGALASRAAPVSELPSDLATRARPPQPIVGGEPTGPQEFDGVVAIVAGQGLCTGTVVAPRLVLTAGHCLRDLPSSTEVEVFYGDQLSGGMSVQAESWGVHPEFCADCKDDIHDYGYVALGADFTVPGGFLLPIVDQTEWDEAMVNDGEVTIVGYGEDPAVPDSIGIKRKVTTKIRSFTPEGLEFFAGGDDRDSCQGDSGGPAFVRLSDGTWRLAGITSRGSSPCGDGGFYGTPYAALCWVRNETDVDLLNGTCDTCDCLDTSPPDEGGCTIEPRGDRPLGGLLPLLLFAPRRRPRDAC